MQSTKQLYGCKLGAVDGPIGHVHDIYFDDQNWMVRYIVADTGHWLPRRQVLLSPHAFGDLKWRNHELSVSLSRSQIEGSPSIETHRPVSRQYEVDYFRYYGWPVYWIGDGMGVPGGFVPIIGQPIEPGRGDANANDDIHLRSTRAIAGYQVHAVDGAVGLVSDFMVDETTWSIRTIEVETGRWYSPKHVRLSPRDIERISYQRSAVYAAVTQQDVQATADGGIVSVGREFRAGILFAE